MVMVGVKVKVKVNVTVKVKVNVKTSDQFHPSLTSMANRKQTKNRFFKFTIKCNKIFSYDSFIYGFSLCPDCVNEIVSDGR